MGFVEQMLDRRTLALPETIEPHLEILVYRRKHIAVRVRLVWLQREALRSGLVRDLGGD